MMKVMHLVAAPGDPRAVSGPEVLVRDVLLPMSGRFGMEASCAVTGPSRAAEQMTQRGWQVHTLPYKGWRSGVRFRRDLSRLLRSERPDLLVSHGHCLLDALVSGTCSRLGFPHAIVRYVVLEDMRRSWWRRLLLRRADNRALRRASAVVFASPSSRRRAVDRLGLDPERAVFISVPIDLERFRPAETPPPQPTVIAVGQLTAEKGWEFFVDALGRVRREIGDGFLARIYGSGPLKSELRRRIRLASLENIAELIDHCDDMPGALRQGWIYCSTSRREGLSIAAAEAAACGLPLVLSKVSGSDVLVEVAENGYIESIGDTLAVAERIVRLLRDDALREKMSIASRRRAEKLFDRATIEKHYAELFRRAVG